jgi:dUTP pyrophosphatase
MAIKFEKVSKFAAADFNLPVRKTKNSAGYDFEVAEDIVIPTWTSQLLALTKATPQPIEPYSLEELGALTKMTKAKPSLVSTGVKCHLEPGYYLELSVRSSTPLKYWLVLANGVGIIDADYCDNPDNEGEIFFQLINMSPFDIYLKKGDIIGQGIIKRYEVTDDDSNSEKSERAGGFGSTSAAADAAMPLTDPAMPVSRDLVGFNLGFDNFNTGQRMWGHRV